MRNSVSWNGIGPQRQIFLSSHISLLVGGLILKPTEMKNTVENNTVEFVRKGCACLSGIVADTVYANINFALH